VRTNDDAVAEKAMARIQESNAAVKVLEGAPK
jgi:hypothetical protein